MKIYNKLVRDKIPEIIAGNGQTARTRILSEAEYRTELINKLGEEYKEFLQDYSLQELADLQEVIYALADNISSREALERVRLQKLAERGGFSERIFLESVSE